MIDHVGFLEWKKPLDPAVDGVSIRRSPVEVGSSSHYLRRVIYIPGGFFWISSINSTFHSGFQYQIKVYRGSRDLKRCNNPDGEWNPGLE